MNAGGSILAVIPCLDEARHLPRLLGMLRGWPELSKIVVADGGSTDDSREIVRAAVRIDPRIALIDNPDRIQSAGINRAVEAHGAHHAWLLRLDAHSSYPARFPAILLEAARTHAARSVVVGMKTEGARGVPAAVAAAQNSRLGTGGSAHRMSGAGGYVDHGHHALMRIAEFRRAGGYCEAMPCNEDAELDVRLTQEGARIWLETGATIGYHPRATFTGLFRQYFRYGTGRATTLDRHRNAPKLRQLLLVGIAPAVAMAAAAPMVGPWAAAPAMLWAGLCQGWGTWLALRTRRIDVLMSGSAAMTMHFAWSLGFIVGWLKAKGGRAPPFRPGFPAAGALPDPA